MSALALLGFLLAAPQVTAAEMQTDTNASAVAAAGCLIKSAVDLDDGKTSPEILLRGALAECADKVSSFRSKLTAQGDRILAPLESAKRDEMVEKTFSKLSQKMENLAIAAVLKSRASKN